MRDEEYVYYQDLREKKVTGYSARKQRSHCGKGGRVKLPSDYLTKKEIQNMSGECKSYRLNEQMQWAEFKAMPTDIQAIYLNALRQKYNVSDAQLAKMFGVAQPTASAYLRKNGLNRSGAFSGKEEWDKEGFWAWVHGVPKKEECQSVQEDSAEEDQEPFEVEMTAEEAKEILDILDEVEPVREEPKKEKEVRFKKVIPTTGSMTYEGMTFDILTSISDLLGNTKVKLSVSWEVCDG